jgi:hypothetical protein
MAGTIAATGWNKKVKKILATGREAGQTYLTMLTK